MVGIDMNFELVTPNKIIFGPGRFSEAGALTAGRGKVTLVVSGKGALRTTGILDRLDGMLSEKGVATVHYSVPSEPTIETIDSGVAAAKEAKCDLVIGIGGGSALDSAKAIAAMMRNEGTLLDHLEVVGKGIPLKSPSAPLMVIPTTAGTGTEATVNSVIKVADKNVKVSLRSPFLLPKIALVDPELTYGLPPDVTASTGMDALTQLIEAYTCRKANAVTDALAMDGMLRASRSLQLAYVNGKDLSAREDLSLAALFSGIALANAGLGAVHGIAAPLGGAAPVPHGVACARLLAPVIGANVKALKARDPGNVALPKYGMVGQLILGRSLKDIDHDAQACVAYLDGLTKRLKIPPLSKFGLTREMIPGIAEKAQNASSMKANPVMLTKDEIASAIEAAL